MFLIQLILNCKSSENNRPRSIYHYSNMAPRLSGKNCKFFKFILYRMWPTVLSAYDRFHASINPIIPLLLQFL